jgi:hypothetical protein
VAVDEPRAATMVRVAPNQGLIVRKLVRIEREMCPWAISSIVLVIKCPTHIE